MSKEKVQEKPRVGVFVCSCGKNIGGVVDVKEVTEYAKTIPNVEVAMLNIYTCADPGQNEIRRAIKEHNLNRVVVAACSPKMHEPTFRNCISEAGLNPYLLEMANLREHDSWVHIWEKDKATEKAKEMLNYTPEYDLERGIAEYIEFIKKYHNHV